MANGTIILAVVVAFVFIMAISCVVAYVRWRRSEKLEVERAQQRVQQRRKSRESIALAIMAHHTHSEDHGDGDQGGGPGDVSPAPAAVDNATTAADRDAFLFATHQLGAIDENSETTASNCGDEGEVGKRHDGHRHRKHKHKKHHHHKHHLSAQTREGRAQRARSRRRRRRTLQDQELPSVEDMSLAVAASPRKRKKKRGLRRKAKTCSTMTAHSSQTAERLDQRRRSLGDRMEQEVRRRARNSARKKFGRALVKLRAHNNFRALLSRDDAAAVSVSAPAVKPKLSRGRSGTIKLARQSFAEHLIATKALRLHSYGLDAHCRSVLRDPTTGRS